MASRRLRLCYSLNTFDLGGAETVALDLARHHDRSRFDVEVVSFIEPRRDGRSAMRQRFDAAGVRTHAIVQDGFRSPVALARILSFLARGRFDIVHGHNRGCDYWGARLAPLAGIRHASWTRHSIYGDMSPRQRARYRGLVARGARIVAVSRAVELACVEGDGISAQSVQTIVNGVDLTRFRPRGPAERARIRARLGLSSEQLMLLYVARFTELKAPETFIDLACRLKIRDGRIRGFMCGYGHLDASLRHLAAASNGAVTVLGVRDDVPDLLAACDLFVSTSRVEGLPLNVMEAMACGAPFVAPAIPQIVELIGGRPPLKAQLMEPLPVTGAASGRVIESWAALASASLADAKRLGIVGNCGRQAMVDDYSVQRMTARYEEFFTQLCARR